MLVLFFFEYSCNMWLIGYSDQGGCLDGVQLMVYCGFVYIGYMVLQGFFVVDVCDLIWFIIVNYIVVLLGIWNVYFQVYDDLLLVINVWDLFVDVCFVDEKVYYICLVGDMVSDVQDKGWSVGLCIFDIFIFVQLWEISFLLFNGIGIYCIWYVGGCWVYVFVLIDGFIDYIFLIIDLVDLCKFKVVGCWWLLGMYQVGGEILDWLQGKCYVLYYVIIVGDIVYGSWCDGGLMLLDVKDCIQLRLISYCNWSLLFGGGMYIVLLLLDCDLLVVLDEVVFDNQEDGEKLIWLFDICELINLVSIVIFLLLDEVDYVVKGVYFGLYNLYENCFGSFVSLMLIFVMYQNVGVWVYDIFNLYCLLEIGVLVLVVFERMMDICFGCLWVIQFCDVFVDV